MNIPSKSDWGDITEDCDASVAFKHFFGKSVDEAKELFEEDSLTYQEDLMWMPPIPFNFYAPAFVEYLVSQEAKGDAEAASAFLSITIWWLEFRKQSINKETEKLILDAASRIAHNQGFYGADSEIYGRFMERFARIKELV